jgi:hypothetical protein
LSPPPATLYRLLHHRERHRALARSAQHAAEAAKIMLGRSVHEFNPPVRQERNANFVAWLYAKVIHHPLAKGNLAFGRHRQLDWHEFRSW